MEELRQLLEKHFSGEKLMKWTVYGSYRRYYPKNHDPFMTHEALGGGVNVFDEENNHIGFLHY